MSGRNEMLVIKVELPPFMGRVQQHYRGTDHTWELVRKALEIALQDP